MSIWETSEKSQLKLENLINEIFYFVYMIIIFEVFRHLFEI